MRYAICCGSLLVALTACPYGGPHRDVSQNSPSKSSTVATNPRAGESSTNPMNPIVPPQKDMPGNRIAPAATAETNVELTEYEIRMPDTINAGHERFRIVNSGKENHNFVITGNGVSAQLPNDLTRGDTTDIAMDLKPGTYTVFCPVDGHRGKGMQRTLTVK